MIRRLKVEDSFLLLGKKTNPYPYIKLADYYIQPSRCEPSPMMLGEVMLLHTPAICIATGSIRELTDQWKAVYLIDFSITEIKKAMKRFMLDDDLLQEIIEEQKDVDILAYNKKICDQITDLFSTV